VLGWKVLRLNDHDVVQDLDAVVVRIAEVARRLALATP
jgi:very-short-patch-repair endonuclease